MAKKGIKLDFGKIHNKILLIFRIFCAALILLVLLNVIFVSYLQRMVGAKLDFELFFWNILLIAVLAAPFTKLFTLKDKEIKNNKLALISFISTIILCGIVIYFTLAGISLLIENLKLTGFILSMK